MSNPLSGESATEITPAVTIVEWRKRPEEEEEEEKIVLQRKKEERIQLLSWGGSEGRGSYPFRLSEL